MADFNQQKLLEELHDPTQDTHLSGVARLLAARHKGQTLLSRQSMIETINAVENEIGGEIAAYHTAREAVMNLVGSTRIDGSKVGRIVTELLDAVEPARDITKPVSERLEAYVNGERGITKEAVVDLMLDLGAEIGDIDAVTEALSVVAQDRSDYYSPEAAKVIAEHLAEKLNGAKQNSYAETHQ